MATDDSNPPLWNRWVAREMWAWGLINASDITTSGQLQSGRSFQFFFKSSHPFADLTIHNPPYLALEFVRHTFQGQASGEYVEGSISLRRAQF